MTHELAEDFVENRMKLRSGTCWFTGFRHSQLLSSLSVSMHGVNDAAMYSGNDDIMCSVLFYFEKVTNPGL